MIFMRYMHKRRHGRVDFTQEELGSVLNNEAPGSPNLSILSFKGWAFNIHDILIFINIFTGCFHGRTIGLLSCSHSRPIQGVDIPTLSWPKADFPKYKYPLHDHLRENVQEDERCLAQVEELIEKAVSTNFFLIKIYFKYFLFDRPRMVNLWLELFLSLSSLRVETTTPAPASSRVWLTFVRNTTFP